MFSGDKQMKCGKCGKKTKWVRCANCNGKGPTQMTTCKLKCDAGYKCENGPRDPSHN